MKKQHIEKHTGSLYEATKELDLKDIAKLIRAEISFYTKSGLLPKLNYRVNIARYAGGQSLTIRVNDGNSWRKMNEKEKEVYNCLKTIGSQFNRYEDALFHCDYWSGNFMFFVLIPSETFI